ncbi:MAG: PilZ domain-containing protein [Burkholderiaceae bacterium]
MASSQRKNFSWSRPAAADRRPILRLSAGGCKWDVRLVGLISRKRFLVSHPMDEGKLVFVKEGELLDVSNFDGAVISAFKASVMRVILGETPGLELSLPPLEERRRESVRQSRRVFCVMPCSVRYGPEADALRAGFTGDLSDSGAQIAIDLLPLPPSVTQVDVSMRLSVLGESRTMTVRAAIRSSAVDPRPSVDAVLLGLQFVELDPNDRLVLAMFLCERLLADADDVFGAIR